MAYTQLSIYNLALRNLGVTASIQSVEGNDAKVVALNTFYEMARDQTLKDADWNFARAYCTMSPTESGTSDNPKYEYEYDRPDNCIYTREVYLVKPGENLPFEPASSYSTGKEVINTNTYGASLVFTRRVTNEAFFPVDFVNALSWHLSFLICDAIGLAGKKENTTKTYSYMLSKAITSNANEGYDVVDEKDAPWIDARG